MRKIVNIIIFILLASVILSFSSCGDGKKNEADKKQESIYSTSSGTLRISPLTDASDENSELLSEEKAKKLSDDAADKYEYELSFLTENNPSVAELNADTDIITSPDDALLSLISEFDGLSEKLTGLFGIYSSPSSFVFENGNVKKTVSDAKLDFSAVNNGYAVEKALSYLKEEKMIAGFYISDGIVAGVCSERNKPRAFNIGVTFPDSDEIYGNFSVTDGYVAQVGVSDIMPDGAASGEYEKLGNVKAVVYCEDGCAAEAIATVLCQNSIEVMNTLYENCDIRFEALLLTDSGDFVCTKGLENSSIFIRNEKTSTDDVKSGE